eukprot:12017197-Prorocentrum_lima.AAC.1
MCHGCLMAKIKDAARDFGLPWTSEDTRRTVDLHFNPHRAASGDSWLCSTVIDPDTLKKLWNIVA